MLPKEITHRVPLSQLHYEKTGIAVPWDGVDLFIPYKKISLDPVTGCMLEEMAGNFRADLNMLLRITQKTGEIEGIEIQPHSEGLTELNNAIDCMKVFRRKIEALTIKGSLTIPKARKILKRLKYKIESDDCLNQLLARIVADYSPQRITDEFKLPLAKLKYSQKGVSFSHERNRYHVAANLLSGLVPRARLNLIRDRMNGKATFTHYHEAFFQWNMETTSLVVGRTKDKLISGHLQVRNPKATKRACCQEIITSFNSYKVRSIKRLERLLAQWGISPGDQEAGRYIARRLAPIVEPGLVFPVILKVVQFGSKNISIRLGGEKQVIPPTKFTFKTSSIFNRVKADLKVFTNEIQVHADKVKKFQWHVLKPHYRLGPKKYEVRGIDIKPHIKGQLSRIYKLNVVKMSPPTSSVPSVPRTKPLVKKVKTIPPISTNAYIQILEGMAIAIYVNENGYWFHVKKVNANKDRLIWEVKTEQLATYIFDWPGKRNLVRIVQRILSMSRRVIPTSSTVGYVARVVHPHGDIPTWEQNILQTL